MGSSTDIETAAPGNGRRIPWGLLVALGIGLCIEAYVGITWKPDVERNRLYEGGKTPSVEESIVQWQTYELYHSRRAVDVLMMGDSSCLMGAVPRVIEERTGLAARNIGTVATFYPEGHAIQLEKWIRHRGAPRLLVYHVSMFAGIGHYSQKEIDDYGLVRRFRKFLNKKHGGMAWYLPTFRLRHVARSTLAELFTSEKAAEEFLTVRRGPYPSDVEVRRTLHETRGRLYEPERWNRVQYNQGYGPGPKLHPDVRRWLEQIAAMSREHSFPILVVINPLRDWIDNAVSREHHRRFLATLKDMLGPGDNIHYLDPSLRFYPPELCATICHLHPKGAIRNSEEIADWILKNLLHKRVPPTRRTGPADPTRRSGAGRPAGSLAAGAGAC